MADELLTRYCPSCGARVKAPPAAFTKPRQCPKCQTVVSFRDYPREQPPEPPSDFQPSPTEWFDYALYAALLALPVFVLLTLLCLAFGIGDLALFGAGACLVLTLPFMTRYGQLQGKLAGVSRDNRLLVAQNAALRGDLAEATELYRGFRANFDSLVSDEFVRLRAEHDGRMEAVIERERLAEESQSVVDALGKRFLKDTVSNISARLNPNNFAASSDRLSKVIAFCRKSKYEIPDSYKDHLIFELKSQYAQVLIRQDEREEQARIKALIREEQRAEREIARELQRVANEKAALEKALAEALAESHDAHSAEVERLQLLLAEAEAKGIRALSMAQQTKAGHIYVISNLGSFGEDVYKIGMTRRLEPLDRVKELGDASVPFPFDVHMMISCEDAPKLENTLHRALHRNRVNRVNLRKEFFRVGFDEIRQIVEANHGEVAYEATAEALQYRETQNMSDDEFDQISAVFDTLPPEDDEAEDLEKAIGTVEDAISPI